MLHSLTPAEPYMHRYPGYSTFLIVTDNSKTIINGVQQGTFLPPNGGSDDIISLAIETGMLNPSEFKSLCKTYRDPDMLKKYLVEKVNKKYSVDAAQSDTTHSKTCTDVITRTNSSTNSASSTTVATTTSQMTADTSEKTSDCSKTTRKHVEEQQCKKKSSVKTVDNIKRRYKTFGKKIVKPFSDSSSKQNSGKDKKDAEKLLEWEISTTPVTRSSKKDDKSRRIDIEIPPSFKDLLKGVEETLKTKVKSCEDYASKDDSSSKGKGGQSSCIDTTTTPSAFKNPYKPVDETLKTKMDECKDSRNNPAVVTFASTTSSNDNDDKSSCIDTSPPSGFNNLFKPVDETLKEKINDVFKNLFKRITATPKTTVSCYGDSTNNSAKISNVSSNETDPNLSTSKSAKKKKRLIRVRKRKAKESMEESSVVKKTKTKKRKRMTYKIRKEKKADILKDESKQSVTTEIKKTQTFVLDHVIVISSSESSSDECDGPREAPKKKRRINCDSQRHR